VVVVVDMMTADMVVAEAGVSHFVCDLSRFAISFLAFFCSLDSPRST